MVTIRRDQIAMFDQHAEAQFINRLMDFLRQTQPTAGPPVSDETLRKMTENGVRRARSHGLDWESSIAAFVSLMFQIAPNFDEHPAFRAVLEDPSLPANQRLLHLDQRVPPSAYVEAAQNYNMGAWFE